MDKKSTTGAPTTVTDLLQRIKGKPVVHKVVESITQDVIAESQTNPGTMYLTPSGIMMAGYIIAEANALNDVNAVSSDGLVSLTKTSADGGSANVYASNIATSTYVDNQIKSKFEANDAMLLVGTISASSGGGTIPVSSINDYLYSIEGNVSPEEISGFLYFSEFVKYFRISAGYTLRVTSSGTITMPDAQGTGTDSVDVETGDMIIFTQNKARDISGHVLKNDFTVIQNNVDIATATTVGLVKVPTENGISVDSDGAIKLAQATGTQYGTVKLGASSPNSSQNIQQYTVDDRWYGVTKNFGDDKLMVNVPWTDTSVQNVVVTASQGAGTTGITVSVDNISGSTTLPFANSNNAGLMSSADKSKLDNIESGAQVNTLEGIDVHQGSSYHNIQTANKIAQIAFGDGFKLGNPDVDGADVLLNFKTYTAPANSGGIGMILKLQDNVTSGSDLATWNIPLVTTSTSGIMSGSDKGVLDTAVQTVSNSTKSGTTVTLNQVNDGNVPTAAISATSGTDGIMTFDQYKQITNALFWQ